tara:strand:+ start:1449 stop:1946 length:498 start_codon:yes stop_codon:yes gene_type:complete
MALTTNDIRGFIMRANSPTPGQSLTENPEAPNAWEKPPQITTKEEAINYFLELFLEEETFLSLMDLLSTGTPVMGLVEFYLTRAFQEGVVNPDLMMLLAEPLAYVLMGLAERQGIEVTIVDDPEEEEGTNIMRTKLQTITEPKNDQEIDLDEKIERVPSLMERGV